MISTLCRRPHPQQGQRPAEKHHENQRLQPQSGWWPTEVSAGAGPGSSEDKKAGGSSPNTRCGQMTLQGIELPKSMVKVF